MQIKISWLCHMGVGIKTINYLNNKDNVIFSMMRCGIEICGQNP